MKLAILFSSTAIGGAETLMARISRYSIRHNYDLQLVNTSCESVIKDLIEPEKFSSIVDLSLSLGTGLMTKKEFERLVAAKELVSKTADEIHILAPYFHNIQIAMAAFRPYADRVRITTAFLHTEAWSRALFTIPLFGKRQQIRDLKQNSLYYYQKHLLQRLDLGSANWFMSDLVKKYHEYYYDVQLPNSRVIPLPFDIPEIDPVVLNRSRKNSDILKVVWLGRFEYFKNPSIKKTYEALDRLTEEHKDLKVEFDLIGYGNEKYEKDIRKEVKTSGRLQVKYLGKIFPDKLPEVISQYDVGVAMGTSALHIGGMRIPSILVDASDEKHINQIKGCWLYEAPVGFLGEGVYADICGYSVKARQELSTMFEELLDRGHGSETLGNKCFEYTLENYDENKIMPQIIDAWTSSTFSPGDMEVYRHPPLKRFIRRTAKRILRR